MPDPSTTRSCRVLLVEDNPGDARLIAQLLRDVDEGGFQVSTVGSIGEASTRLGAEGADAILLDLSLPDATGLEGLDAIRHIAPTTPVVILTGETKRGLAQAAVRAGAQDYLMKGITNGPAITRAIRYALERAVSERERRVAFERLLEIQRLHEVDDLKNRLINTLSHELNTPLTSMRIQLHLLTSVSEGELSQTQRRALERLSTNTQRLAELAGRMVSMARIKTGSFVIHPAKDRMDHVVAHAVEDYQARAAAAGVALTLEPCPTVAASFDVQRISEVINSLLDNAIRYTPRGGRVAVRVRLDGDEVRVEVRDTGVGMNESQLDDLFRPMVAIHDPHRVTTTGSGLSLFIAREIVTAHGGQLRATSDGIDQGTTFIMTLGLEAPKVPDGA